MEKDQDIIPVSIGGGETIIELDKEPAISAIFLKALRLGIFRAGFPSQTINFPKTKIILNNRKIDTDSVQKYKNVCGFSLDDNTERIPITYFQALFTPVLGKYITSDAFPVNPLGLVHIFQSFTQTQPVSAEQTIDLSCSLTSAAFTPRGLETTFTLEAKADSQLVWQGVSVFLTKKKKKAKSKKPQDELFLDARESFHVPSDTGRKYARVSNDYNPHHLHSIPAKLFGFKRAIAHGMWSLARVTASLEKEYLFIQNMAPGKDLCIQTWFKRPIFMPADVTLGYEENKSSSNNSLNLDFELREKQSGIPHFKGSLFSKGTNL